MLEYAVLMQGAKTIKKTRCKLFWQNMRIKEKTSDLVKSPKYFLSTHSFLLTFIQSRILQKLKQHSHTQNSELTEQEFII
jgi:hypothetical protein